LRYTQHKDELIAVDFKEPFQVFGRTGPLAGSCHAGRDGPFSHRGPGAGPVGPSQHRSHLPLWRALVKVPRPSG